jgi:hypothetical protein
MNAFYLWMHFIYECILKVERTTSINFLLAEAKGLWKQKRRRAEDFEKNIWTESGTVTTLFVALKSCCYCLLEVLVNLWKGCLYNNSNITCKAHSIFCLNYGSFSFFWSQPNSLDLRSNSLSHLPRHTLIIFIHMLRLIN